MKPVYLLSLISVIVLQPSIAHALTPEQIQKVARSVVLKISVEGEEKSAPIFGSGVLIRKNGTTYTLVTNAHVVCINGSAHNCKKHKEFSIMTSDQKRYKVKSTAVKNLPGLDLSTIQFQSDRNYSVASFGDSETVKVDDPIYASGFPSVKNSFSFSHGSIIANVKNQITGGYNIFYDASTNKGMSGGGVFNNQGKLVAIHGQGDRFTSSSLVNKASREASSGLSNSIADLMVGMKIGINRGIPIKHLRNELSPRVSEPNVKVTDADGWFAIALNKFINNDKINTDKNTKEAIESCNEAIRLNPNYLMAYYIRSRLWNNLGMAVNELNDYEKIIQLQPTSSGTYLARSIAKFQAKNSNTQLGTSEIKFNYIEEALNDANKAIELDPEYPFSYMIRASIYLSDKKISLALADYDQSIKIDPKNTLALFARSMAHMYSEKTLLAISAINQAIEVDPSNDLFFFYRAQMKLALSDRLGAIADINRAISLKENNSGDTNIYHLYLASLKNNQSNSSGTISLTNQETLNALQPGTVLFYLTQAAAKQSQRDFQGALADYNEAIKIEPSAQSYMSRAFFKQQEIKDYQGAEEDYTRAISFESSTYTTMLYMYRGTLRSQYLQNKKGAITDLQEAVRICKQRSSETECMVYTHLLSSVTSGS
jgi:tetratricopeptide (TPR) repeat protein/V8-like Glu-specific endopeptidase